MLRHCGKGPHVEERTLDRISSRSDYEYFLLADLKAYGVKRWSFDSAWRHPALRYQRWMRKVEYLQTTHGRISRVRRFVARFMLERLSLATGITLPPGVCGPGVSIAHHGTLVVNSRARIGAGCRLHPTVTIGISNGGVPCIGEAVYIGPGAVLYGAITVGDGAVIGANSVVNRDVPPGVTVAGSPAKVIATRDSSSLMPQWRSQTMQASPQQNG